MIVVDKDFPFKKCSEISKECCDYLLLLRVWRKLPRKSTVKTFFECFLSAKNYCILYFKRTSFYLQLVKSRKIPQDFFNLKNILSKLWSNRFILFKKNVAFFKKIKFQTLLLTFVVESKLGNIIEKVVNCYRNFIKFPPFSKIYCYLKKTFTKKLRKT